MKKLITLGEEKAPAIIQEEKKGFLLLDTGSKNEMRWCVAQTFPEDNHKVFQTIACFHGQHRAEAAAFFKTL